MIFRFKGSSTAGGMLFALVVTLAGSPALASEATDLGRQVFLTKAVPACAVCHALDAAGASGAIGPSLDEIKPDADRVEKAVRGGIGAMPAYSGTLSDAEIKAVAQYVAKASGSAK